MDRTCWRVPPSAIVGGFQIINITKTQIHTVVNLAVLLLGDSLKQTAGGEGEAFAKGNFKSCPEWCCAKVVMIGFSFRVRDRRDKGPMNLSSAYGPGMALLLSLDAEGMWGIYPRKPRLESAFSTRSLAIRRAAFFYSAKQAQPLWGDTGDHLPKLGQSLPKLTVRATVRFSPDSGPHKNNDFGLEVRFACNRRHLSEDTLPHGTRRKNAGRNRRPRTVLAYRLSGWFFLDRGLLALKGKKRLNSPLVPK